MIETIKSQVFPTSRNPIYIRLGYSPGYHTPKEFINPVYTVAINNCVQALHSDAGRAYAHYDMLINEFTGVPL
jgi:hypothetical protein